MFNEIDKSQTKFYEHVLTLLNRTHNQFKQPTIIDRWIHCFFNVIDNESIYVCVFLRHEAHSMNIYLAQVRVCSTFQVYSIFELFVGLSQDGDCFTCCCCCEAETLLSEFQVISNRQIISSTCFHAKYELPPQHQLSKPKVHSSIKWLKFPCISLTK